MKILGSGPMILLTDILAVSDAMKNVAAFATGNFTVAGAIDTVADVAVVASQFQILYKTMEKFQGGILVGGGVIYKTIAVVTAVEAANGFGPPDTGQAFTTGASNFDAVRGFLVSADPNPSQWSGSAADVYAARNDDQKGFAARVAELDREIAILMGLQAGQVEKVRNGLAGVKVTLGAAAIIVGALVGSAIASGDFAGTAVTKFVNATCTAAFLTVLGLLS